MYDVHTSGYTEHPSALKLEIDESLKRLNESHAAVVHHIEEVPGLAAMIFHAYCDNENAPFKQVANINSDVVVVSRLNNFHSLLH